MQACGLLCGWGLAKTDLVRRAISKKKKDVMEKLGVEFMADAKIHTPEAKEKDLRAVWNAVEKASSYSFNKSHSAAYGIISYRTLWLKSHYTIEFVCATLTYCKTKEKTLLAMADAAKLGIKVEQPDINVSEYGFVPRDKGHVSYGFKTIKGVGEKPTNEIIRAREDEGKFTGFIDFMIKVDSRIVNKIVIDALIWSGAFDRIEKADKRVLATSGRTWVSGFKYSDSGKVLQKKTMGLLDIKAKIRTQDQWTEEQTNRSRSIKYNSDMKLNLYEEQKIADFMAGKPSKLKTNSTIKELVKKQIQYLDYSFYMLDDIEIPEGMRPESFGKGSKLNIVNRLIQKKIDVCPEETRGRAKMLKRQVVLYDKYEKSCFLNKMLTPVKAELLRVKDFDIPKWNAEKEHRDGRSAMMIIFGMLKSKTKTYTKNGTGMYNIVITDGPGTVKMVMWANDTEDMMKEVKENDYVVVLATKKIDFRKEESYSCHSILKSDGQEEVSSLF